DGWQRRIGRIGGAQVVERTYKVQVDVELLDGCCYREIHHRFGTNRIGELDHPALDLVSSFIEEDLPAGNVRSTEDDRVSHSSSHAQIGETLHAHFAAR